MRILIQRVTNASVAIQGTTHCSIGAGALVLLGIDTTDTTTDADYLIGKLTALRIFNDTNDVMNLDIKHVDGELLIVSQFTLYGTTRKGNRPSYIGAARAEQAIPLYNYFLEQASVVLGRSVQAGVFGADMQVSLVNDGPVTIWIDSKEK